MNESSATRTEGTRTGCFSCFSGKKGSAGDGVVKQDIKTAANDVKDKITPGNGLHGDNTTL